MSGEDELRRALDGLAPRPAADDEARAGVARAVARRRRRTAVARVAAAVALVGVAAGGAALARSATSDDHPADMATPAHRGGDRPGTGTGPSVPTSAPGGPEVTFGNATFTLPDGWSASPLAAGGDALCVAPAGNPAPRWEGCGGLALYHGDLPGFAGRPYERGAPWSFAHDRGPVPCPLAPGDPAAGGGDTVVPGAVRGRDPIDSGLRPVGDHTADYDQWLARCSRSNRTFTPRAWYLPRSRIVIFDVLGRPETEAILGSFRFAGAGG